MLVLNTHSPQRRHTERGECETNDRQQCHRYSGPAWEKNGKESQGKMISIDTQLEQTKMKQKEVDSNLEGRTAINKTMSMNQINYNLHYHRPVGPCPHNSVPIPVR